MENDQQNNQRGNSRPPRRGNSNGQGQAGRQNGGNRGGRGSRGNGGDGGGQNRQNSGLSMPGANASRGAAVRAQRRVQADAQKIANQYASAANAEQQPRRANVIADEMDKLKITFLGGQGGIGEQNMQVVEWQDDALILDCGNNLDVDLPGVNYTISDPSYLETIKHKIRGYVVSHGHLDHIGGLKHIVPKYPAPIHGSRFTLGVVQKTFEDAVAETGLDFTPELVVMNMDGHERLKLGVFMVELVRITHSVPESSCMIVDTPVGRIINTGDWRLDPEPLDEKPSDADRLRELGDEGVLLLMSDSCNAQLPGRTPTEHTLQQSFHDVIGGAEGRVFVALFSSNMNRVQMTVNAAVATGRRVALDGRSMMSYAEIAVRQGILKIPKGTVLPMREMPNIPDNQVLVICTGGQGEPGAALQRMAEGEHKHIKLHEGDTVVVSSSPIPGNERRYEQIGNQLTLLGVHLYRHPTHEVDGVGPLHVSGHARRDEYRELLHIIRPKYFLPIYAGARNRRYFFELAVEEGWKRENLIMANDGETLAFTANSWERAGEVPHGSLLVDQTGAVVNGIVVKDRVLLSEGGLVAVVITVDKKSGNLLTSPDIISRGFIYMRENEEVMNGLRGELRRAVQQRFKRVDLDRFKAELKDHITHYLFEQTNHTPIVIPVVNVIGGKAEGGQGASDGGSRSSGRGGNNHTNSGVPAVQTVHQDAPTQTTEELAIDQEKRFQAMRARLLGEGSNRD
ncbi:MAG TPA: ribonuclease J [Candidatus Saccharimonadales bacterium]|nr:ribonuclease J [Candidatus Saccharimonadales bacterium]